MKPTSFFRAAGLALALALAGGCAGLGTGAQDSGSGPDAASQSVAKNEPYYPTSFSDFEVPGELKMDRKDTMLINTASFTGGILHFTGWVEVNSLTDYFINSMEKNGWKRTGEVRYQNILLAFTKPTKNCMISIYEGNLGGKTQVYVYITEDLTAGGGM